MQTLKMLDDGGERMGGYLVVWGSPARRDLHGEYFSPETELGLDWYEKRPVLYHHGLDAHVKTAPIGVIDRVQVDETGVWAEAQLNLRHRYGRQVQTLVERGALGWSSGSLPHLVDVEHDGHIRRWIIVEGSVTPTPAEPRMTDVRLLSDERAVKSAYAAIGQDAAHLFDTAHLFETENNQAEKTVTDVPVEERKIMYDSNATKSDYLGRKRLPLPTMEDTAPLDGRAPAITVGSPYDTLDALDMLHGYVLLRHGKGFNGVSERYAGALADKIGRARMTAIKADELNRSTLTGYGDEWVPDLWSAQIWNRARLENVILPLFPSIEMPSNPFEVSTEANDPSVFYVPETADEAALTLGATNPIPDSRVGSGKVQLTARKLALRVGLSAELIEDSIVPILAMYRQQAVRAILDSIDNVLLNGDTVTTATGNINKDNAAPSAGDRFLIFDGMRKLPLVTNTANRVDAGNIAPTLALLRAARFKMEPRYSTRPTDLAWVVDAGTYAKMLSMPEYITMDKAGTNATAITGQIGYLDGSPVVVSAEMPTTMASGRIGVGPNDRGTALAVYRPGWTVGYRRKIAVSVDYLPYYDSYQMTATVRLAFTSFDTKVASVLYNVAV